VLCQIQFNYSSLSHSLAAVAGDGALSETGMASRRGAVRVNPVSGALEKVDASRESGTFKSGCLTLPEKYMHAAAEAGLGEGTGMFSHIKSLNRMGVHDVSSGESMSRGGAKASSSGSASSAPKKTFGSALPSKEERSKLAASGRKDAGTGGGKIRQVVQGRTRAVDKPSASGKADCSFERRKGVVNTLGGAKDVTRKPREEAAKMVKGSGNINGFGGTVETNVPPRRLGTKDSAGGGKPPASKSTAPPKKTVVTGTAAGGAGARSTGKVPIGGKASAEDMRAARAAFLAKFE
jgi:hypothetical protein